MWRLILCLVLVSLSTLVAARGYAMSQADSTDSDRPPEVQVIGSDDGSSALDGQVLLGPTCPVVRQGMQCQDQPYAATISIQTPDGSQEITQVTADDAGQFSVPLDPGTYLVVPLSPPGRRLPFARPQQVDVEPASHTSITIQYDTGIR